MTQLLRRTAFCLLLLPLGAACVEEAIEDEIDKQKAEAAGLEGEICEHMQASSGVAIDAPAERGAAAPEVRADHQRYDITLADLGGPKTGVVQFTPAVEGEYVIVLAESLAFAVIDNAGNVKAPLSETTGSEVCVEALLTRHYQLSTDTVTLSFGPTSSPRARLVIEPAE